MPDYWNRKSGERQGDSSAEDPWESPIPTEKTVIEPSKDVTSAILTRKSIRSFKPELPPRETVEEIIDLAARAASGGNLQPWKVYVVTGAKRDGLVESVFKNMGGGKSEQAEYFIYPDNKPGVQLAGDYQQYEDRRFQNGAQMYGLIGVERTNRARKLKHLSRNFAFFDAPIGLIFTVDRIMNQGQFADLGMYCTNLSLLARERGLHTCWQEAWANWPDTLRAHCGIPEREMVFCGCALGYAEEDSLINDLYTPRAPMESFTTFVGDWTESSLPAGMPEPQAFDVKGDFKEVGAAAAGGRGKGAPKARL